MSEREDPAANPQGAASATGPPRAIYSASDAGALILGVDHEAVDDPQADGEHGQ